MNAFRTLFLLSVLSLACASDRPEVRVKRAFEACVKGTETGDAAAVIERLDPQFTGPEGMDRNGAKLYLLGVLRREKIGVTVFSNQIDVKGHQAFQTVELLLTSKGGGLLPQDASRRGFVLRWVETDGVWRIRGCHEITMAIAGGQPRDPTRREAQGDAGHPLSRSTQSGARLAASPPGAGGGGRLALSMPLDMEPPCLRAIS